MEICSSERCTGCMACYNACSAHAIDVVRDAEGFDRPVVNDNKCVSCGKCVKNCPVNSPVQIENFEKSVYACWMIDKEARKTSTSGGAFSAIAEAALKQNGIVYGVILDDALIVRHSSINSVDDLQKLKGSKYVQSKIGNTYQEIRKNLNEKRLVVFSGTPCQVAGLYGYLGKRDDPNLVTIDLVCHGVPSPLMFEEYIKHLEKIKHQKVINVLFRAKEWSWFNFNMQIDYLNGKRDRELSFQNAYFRGFLNEYFLRPSCHQCQYANENRVADITLSDFWWYQAKADEDIDTDEGISMVMINTLKGQELFSKANGLRIFESSVSEAVKSNRAMREPFPPNKEREQFWTDYNQNGFNFIIDHYLHVEKINRRNIDRYINRHYGNRPKILRYYKKLLCIVKNKLC